MKRVKRIAIASGCVVLLCAAVLCADYAVARWQGPKNDKLIKALQEKVKTDAALAPRLAAEQKRITTALLGRKSRDGVVAWVLIGSALVFLAAAKRLAPPALPVPPPRLREDACGGQCASRARSLASVAPASQGVDVTFVDETVARLGRGAEAAIPILQAIQEHYRYLPDEALRRLCELTDITPSQVAGTSSFYGQFRSTPVGRHIVRVCHGTACHVAGARQVTEELHRYLGIPAGADTDPARNFTVTEVACLGCCSLAPVLMVDGHTAGRLTPAGACDALKSFEADPARPEAAG